MNSKLPKVLKGVLMIYFHMFKRFMHAALNSAVRFVLLFPLENVFLGQNKKYYYVIDLEDTDFNTIVCNSSLLNLQWSENLFY